MSKSNPRDARMRFYPYGYQTAVDGWYIPSSAIMCGRVLAVIVWALFCAYCARKGDGPLTVTGWIGLGLTALLVLWPRGLWLGPCPHCRETVGIEARKRQSASFTCPACLQPVRLYRCTYLGG